MTSSLNLGIAYSLREKIYYRWMPSSLFLRAIRWLIYKFLTLFVAPAEAFHFNEDIKNLNVTLAAN